MMESQRKFIYKTLQENRKKEGFIIVLEGPISVGKSTLGHSISKRGVFLGRPVVFLPEHINKKYLDLYLTDQSKYSFSYQTYALNWRFIIHNKAEQLAKAGYCVIVDRGMAGDMAFALMQRNRGYFTDKEWEIYWGLIMEHQQSEWKPDLVIHLKCDSREAFDRLKTRGDQSEIDTYTHEYFDQLQASHLEAFKMYDQIIGMEPPLLPIDWSTVKFDGEYLPEDTIGQFEDQIISYLQSCEPVLSVLE